MSEATLDLVHCASYAAAINHSVGLVRSTECSNPHNESGTEVTRTLARHASSVRWVYLAATLLQE